MFHRHPPKPTPAKHAIYLCASTLFGVFLSMLVHAGLETWLLRRAEGNGTIADIQWHSMFGAGSCALPLVIIVGLPIIGAIGGFLLGRIWWRWVYLEHRWMRKDTPNVRAE
jgi:hypothetical protein